MASGADHYREAEHQLALIEKKSIGSEEILARMAKAQVHATLAVAAAIADDIELGDGRWETVDGRWETVDGRKVWEARS